MSDPPLPPVELWLAAFLWTLVLELPPYGWLLGRRLDSLPAALGVALVVNAATHPALWYVFPRFEPYALWLVVAEAAVVAVEGLLAGAALSAWARARPTARAALGAGLAVALVVNVFSTAVGLVAWPAVERLAAWLS